MRNEAASGFVKYIRAALFGVLAGIIGMVMPLVLFLPILFAYIGRTLNKKSILVSFIVFIALSYLRYNFAGMAMLLVFCLPGAAAIMFVHKRKYGAFDSIMCSMLGISLSFALGALLLGIYIGGNPFIAVVDYVGRAINLTLGQSPDIFIDNWYTSFSVNVMEQQSGFFDLSQFMPALSTPKITGLETIDRAFKISYLVDVFKQSFTQALPTVIAFCIMIPGFANYTAFRTLAKKSGAEVGSMPSFDNFRLPRSFLKGAGMLFVASIVMMIFDAAGYGSFSVVFFTVMNIISFVFAIQGLSILDFLLKRKKLPAPLRVLLGIVAYLVLSQSQILFFIGLLCQIFDIRKMISEFGNGRNNL